MSEQMVLSKSGKWKKRKVNFVKKPVTKLIKRIVSNMAEHKACDVLVSNTTIPGAGAISYLSAIAQGDTTYQRTGNQVKPLSLRLHVGVYNGTAADVDAVRLIIFQWHGTLNAGVPTPPAANDILKDQTAAGLTGQFSKYTVNNRGNYRILYDKFIQLVGNSGVLGFNNPRMAHDYVINISGKKMSKINYSGTGATTASLGRGGLFFMYIGGTGNSVISFNSRINYLDM